MHDIPRPRIVLDPPHEPLRATLDLPDILQPRDRTTRELKLAVQVRPARPRIRVAHHNHDILAAQPPNELILDAAHESLRAGARTSAPAERPAHPAHRETELAREARFCVGGGWDGLWEWGAAGEVGRERDGECRVWGL